MNRAPKTVFIKTYGCQMNEYDSGRMADVLAPLGYARASEPDDADMVILNTCHIREKAAEKVYSELGRLRKLKDAKSRADGDNFGMMLAVAGCVAQAEGEEILRRAPYVDLIFGPQTYHRLPEMIAAAHRQADQGSARGPGVGVIDTEFPAEPKFDSLPEPGANGVSAYLSVQEGCDKFCTFCVVPYTRGAEFSRPASEVLHEARLLVGGGAREITLLGQNVNAYHGAAPIRAGGAKDWGLGRLIRALAEIDGLDRIRYTTSHPRDMDDELIEAHGQTPQLMPFLHLPVQSGSDRVLAAMNRRHDVNLYRDVVDRLRAARSDLALSSDFIVGFPGETDSDFDSTMSLIDEIGFVQAFSFKYSPRPGTPAAADPQTPDSIKSARLSALQSLVDAQQLAFNESLVGTVQSVLLEKRGRKNDQIVGRSPYMQWVHIPDTGVVDCDDGVADRGKCVVGDLVEVMIERAGRNSLTGAPMRDGAERGGDAAVGFSRVERACV